MKLNTMAAVMSHVTEVEEQTARFYEEQAEKQPDFEELLRSWAKENRKLQKNVKRTYFGVITDAIESNFSFGGLDTDNYEVDTTLAPDADAAVVREKAMQLEEHLGNFYAEAARMSDGLLADIPRLFRKIAQKRTERLETLRSR